MSDENVQDPLLADLLEEDKAKEPPSPDNIVIPDDPRIPESVRGKTLSAVLETVDKAQRERDELAKALETLKQSSEAVSERPAQQDSINYVDIIDELAAQKLARKLAGNPVLEQFQGEMLAMLKSLPTQSRIQDQTIDSVITYVKGHHFDDIAAKLAPSTAVVSDGEGVPKPAKRPLVTLNDVQAANLRAYYGSDTDGLKQLVESLKEE